MKLSHLTLVLMTSLTPLTSFAFFCPTNFAQINIGDSIDQVTQQCGKPDSQTDTVKPQENENTPQQWDYYVPQTVSLNGMYQAVPGTLKTQITFDASGKAINISVNGIGVGSTTICGGKNIQLNDTRDSIQAACGKPVFVTKQDNNQGGGAAPGQLPANKVTEFIYHTNPPVKLTFENGKLTGSK